MSRVYSRVVGAFLAAGVSLFLLMAQANQPEEVGYIKPLPSPNPVAELVKAHGCWTGDNHPNVIPGHVIYDGRYLGAKATGQAIDAVFGHSSPLDPALVQAFCS